MKITNGSTVAAIVLGLIGTIIAAMLNTSWWTLAGVGIIAASLPLWTISHQSISELVLGLLRYSRRRRGKNLLYEQEESGVTWGNGETATYLELRPAPFTLSVLSKERGTADLTAVPFSALSQYLVRGDISVARLRVITNGYSVTGESHLASQYLAAIPMDTPPPANQAVVIEVSIALRDSLQAVYNRMTSDSVPVAAGRTSWVTTARLVRALNRERITSRILTQDQVRNYHDRVLDTFNEAIRNETPTHGDGDDYKTVTHIAKRLDAASLREHYTYGNVITSTWDLTGTDRSDAVLDTAITTAAPTLDRATAPAAGTWYAPRYQQGNLQTRALTMGVTVAVPNSPTNRMTDDMDTAVPAFGAGIYLGQTSDDDAVFLNAEGGGRTMWMVAGRQHLAALIARLDVTGIRVIVRAPQARSFVDALDNPWITYGDEDPTEGVLIIDGDNEKPPHPIPAGLSVISFSTRTRPEAAPYMLYAVTTEDFVVKSLSREVEFRWELTHAEEDLIDIARQNATLSHP